MGNPDSEKRDLIEDDFFESVEIDLEESDDKDLLSDVVLLEPIVDYLLKEFKSDLNGIIYSNDDFNHDLDVFFEMYFESGEDAFIQFEFLHIALDLLIYADLMGNNLLEKHESAFVFERLLIVAQKYLNEILDGSIYRKLKEQTIPSYLYSYSYAKKLKDYYLKLMIIKASFGVNDRFSEDSELVNSFYFVNIHLSETLKKNYRL